MSWPAVSTWCFTAEPVKQAWNEWQCTLWYLESTATAGQQYRSLFWFPASSWTTLEYTLVSWGYYDSRTTISKFVFGFLRAAELYWSTLWCLEGSMTAGQLYRSLFWFLESSWTILEYTLVSWGYYDSRTTISGGVCFGFLRAAEFYWGTLWCLEGTMTAGQLYRSLFWFLESSWTILEYTLVSWGYYDSRTTISEFVLVAWEQLTDYIGVHSGVLRTLRQQVNYIGVYFFSLEREMRQQLNYMNIAKTLNVWVTTVLSLRKAPWPLLNYTPQNGVSISSSSIDIRWR